MGTTERADNKHGEGKGITGQDSLSPGSSGETTVRGGTSKSDGSSFKGGTGRGGTRGNVGGPKRTGQGRGSDKGGANAGGRPGESNQTQGTVNRIS